MITLVRRATPAGGNSRDWVRCEQGHEFTVRTAKRKAGKVECARCVRAVFDRTDGRHD